MERRYHERKRANNLAPVPGRAEQLSKAYETLTSDELRRQYDESLGLATKRRSRIDLRPLGFFSKSLTPAEQNWTTWERELLVVILACEHFRSILAGAEVVIHTDHLNNTVMNLALKQPDKILRMLLKVEALVVPRWVYAPRRGQLGDGFSRNPEDRDKVRGESEDKHHLPKTLAEAIELVSKCRLSGGIVDDAEGVTQQTTSSANPSVIRPRRVAARSIPRRVEQTGLKLAIPTLKDPFLLVPLVLVSGRHSQRHLWPGLVS